MKKKNILAENMKRFGTKNLKEDLETPDEIRAQIERYKMAMASMSGKQQNAYYGAYIKPLQQKLDDMEQDKENVKLDPRFGKELKEQEELDDLLDIIMSYVKDPDDAEKELDNFLLRGVNGFSDAVAANITRDARFDKFKR